MDVLDWILIAIPLAIVFAVGMYTRRYMKSVSSFLSGGRLAERYMLAVARGELEVGAVAFVAMFEVISKAGFTLNWWNWVSAPLGLLLAISGFVIYRYRETRSLTLAQFFELRYSRSFRLFAGVLGFGAGLINFGIIPAVGARFFVYFLGLSPTVTLGSFTIPTYIPLMGGFLLITTILALSGGLLTVMITDCLEGIISQILYLFIIGSLLMSFSWPQISFTLATRPSGQSFLNPFDSMGLKDFNLAYVLMGMVLSVYGTMSWQNRSSYNSAALTPHESRMGSVLGIWRGLGKVAVITLLAICAMTYMSHPHFATQATQVHEKLSRITDHQTRQQMQIPVALSQLLPPGIKGALCVILLMGLFGGDATHLHSWGGLLVQDVLVPLHKKSFSTQQHIRLLRLSIGGVAFFAFVFGSLFRQTEYLLMWWSVTQAVYISGAGAALIGGLYWKKGTTAGAWSAMVTGAVISLGGILARQVYGTRFPLNGIEISFFVMLIAVAIYVVVSLLSHQEDFDLDRMLHRGQYAASQPDSRPTPERRFRPMAWFGKIIGMDDDFSLSDKWIAGLLTGYTLFWFGVMVVGSIWNYFSPWPIPVWSSFWEIVGFGLPIFLAVVTGVWFTWGGLRDMRNLFRRLRAAKINPLDNGVVVDHQNFDEFVLSKESPKQAAALVSSIGRDI